MTVAEAVKTALCRAYQTGALCIRSLNAPKEKDMLKGTGSLKKLPVYMKGKKINNVLIIADAPVERSGAISDFLSKLNENEIKYKLVITSGLSDEKTAEKYAQIFKENNCNGIVVIGGGSAIDCAKLAKVKIAGSRIKLFFSKTALYAVPTTAGVGSEASCCAVSYDKKAKSSKITASNMLRPNAAVLDPFLISSLPEDVLARTAMSALSRGVEAYISTSSTKEERENGASAVRLVLDNVLKAHDEKDIEAKAELQKAAYLAGLASGGKNNGYGHNIAIAISGMGRTAYSEASAAALPTVLKAYGEKGYKRLAELAGYVKIKGSTDEEKAKALISKIEMLNKIFGIAKNVKQIKKKDISKTAKAVCNVCNPSYAAPKILFFEDMCAVLRNIK